MDWTLFSLVTVILIVMMTFGGLAYCSSESSKRAHTLLEESEGPRNKALQNLMQGHTIVRIWQPKPPKGDLYMELDDGTIVKFYHTSGLYVYKVEME